MADTPSRDPLEILGNDVFYMVLTHLDTADLVAVEGVNKLWRDFTKAQTHLWKKHCAQNRVDFVEFEEDGLGKRRDDDQMAELIRLATKSNVQLRQAWSKCQPNDWVLHANEGPGRISQIVHGPLAEHITALVEMERENDKWELHVFNKFTGKLEFRNLFVRPGKLVAGGKWVAVSHNGDPHGGGPLLFRPRLHGVTVYNVPSDQVIAEDIEEGEMPQLVEQGELFAVMECDCMAIYHDHYTGDSFLFGVASDEIVEVCLDDADWEPSYIPIDLPEPHTRPWSFEVDDDFFYIQVIERVHVFSRTTHQRIVSLGRTRQDANVPMAALAFKVPTQAMVDINKAMYDSEEPTKAMTVQLRQVTEHGMTESIWAHEEEGFWDHANDPFDSDHHSDGSDSDSDSFVDAGSNPFHAPVPTFQPDDAGGAAQIGPDPDELPPPPAADGEDQERPVVPSGPAPFNFFDMEDLTGAEHNETEWTLGEQYQNAIGDNRLLRNNNLILAVGLTGLLVVRNYKGLFLNLAKSSLSLHERRRVVAAHAIIIGLPWDCKALRAEGCIHSIATSGDMVVMHENTAGIIILDTSQLPELPLTREDEVFTPPVAHILRIPWTPFYRLIRSIAVTPDILVDSRAIYCVNPRDAGRQREDPLHEEWTQMMGGNDASIKVWSFRPPPARAENPKEVQTAAAQASSETQSC